MRGQYPTHITFFYTSSNGAPSWGNEQALLPLVRKFRCKCFQDDSWRQKVRFNGKYANLTTRERIEMGIERVT